MLNPVRVAEARALLAWVRNLRITNTAVHVTGWRKHAAEKLALVAEMRRDAWMPWDYTVELWVCECCMLVHANGECCADDRHDVDGQEVWSKVDFDRDSVAMGGEHRTSCAVRVFDDGSDCDCDSRDFVALPCDGCNNASHGSRYLFTLFVNDRRNQPVS